MHDIDMRLTDAAMERLHWNPVGPVVTLCTLLTVHTRCVVLEEQGQTLQRMPEKPSTLLSVLILHRNNSVTQTRNSKVPKTIHLNPVSQDPTCVIGP